MVIFDIEAITRRHDMERKELEALALDIMARAEMVALATMGSDPYPHIRALFNLRDERRFPGPAAYQADKGLSVYLGTNTSSIKVREAGQAPWVSVYYMIPSEIKGIMLSGKAVADPEAKRAMWMDDWEIYYPLGRDDPDYTVLRIDPVRVRGWSEGSAVDMEL
jgi:general stress protein 26